MEPMVSSLRRSDIPKMSNTQKTKYIIEMSRIEGLISKLYLIS